MIKEILYYDINARKTDIFIENLNNSEICKSDFMCFIILICLFVWFDLIWNSHREFSNIAVRGKSGGGEEDPPPARLKQVQFALNRKHAFFDATP